MRWLLVKSHPPALERRYTRRIISSGRTFREVRAVALAWLEQHPTEQRCLAFDTRDESRTPRPINRRKSRAVS